MALKVLQEQGLNRSPIEYKSILQYDLPRIQRMVAGLVSRDGQQLVHIGPPVDHTVIKQKEVRPRQVPGGVL